MNENENERLERDAIALIKQYGWALPKPAKEFFKRLADFLGWHYLKGIL